MRHLLKKLWEEDEGQDLLEYALLAALVALGVTAALKPLATAISTIFNNVLTSLS